MYRRRSPDPSHDYNHHSLQINGPYALVFGIVFILCPLLLNAGAYIAIVVYIVRSKRRVFVHLFNSAIKPKAVLKMEWHATIRSTRSTFIIFTIFLICWTPYTIIKIMDHDGRIPVGLYCMASRLIYLVFKVSASNFNRILLWRACDS